MRIRNLKPTIAVWLMPLVIRKTGFQKPALRHSRAREKETPVTYIVGKRRRTRCSYSWNATWLKRKKQNWFLILYSRIFVIYSLGVIGARLPWAREVAIISFAHNTNSFSNTKEGLKTQFATSTLAPVTHALGNSSPPHGGVSYPNLSLYTLYTWSTYSSSRSSSCRP